MQAILTHPPTPSVYRDTVYILRSTLKRVLCGTAKGEGRRKYNSGNVGSIPTVGIDGESFSFRASWRKAPELELTIVRKVLRSIILCARRGACGGF